MKRFLLFAAFAFIFHSSQSQDSTGTRYDNDTLYTRSGFKITDNQMLKIGTGSMPDGDFKYIRISSTSFFQYQGNDAYRSQKNAANSLAASTAGHQYKVVRIDKRGNKKHGFKYLPIINVGAVRYEVDIDNAIASGEIDVPEQFKAKQKPAVVVEVKSGLSVADEIAKLKKLYDDSLITKEEYEAGKKKILSQ